MKKTRVTEQPVYDNAHYIVPPSHPDYNYWLGVQAAQAEWKDAVCSDMTDAVDVALHTRLIERQQVWRDVAVEIATGVVSPRALHELRQALAFAIQRDEDASNEQKRSRLQSALRLTRLRQDAHGQRRQAESLAYTQKQIAAALERLEIPTRLERKHTA